MSTTYIPGWSEPAALAYRPDRRASDDTIARLRAELAARPTDLDVLDAAQTAYKAGYSAGFRAASS